MPPSCQCGNCRPGELYERRSSQLWVNLWLPPWSQASSLKPRLMLILFVKMMFSSSSPWKCFPGGWSWLLSAWTMKQEDSHLIICEIGTLGMRGEKSLNLPSISLLGKAVTFGLELIKDFVFQRLVQCPCKSRIMRANLPEACSVYLFILELRCR